jgi:hypothetical protein
VCSRWPRLPLGPADEGDESEVAVDRLPRSHLRFTSVDDDPSLACLSSLDRSASMATADGRETTTPERCIVCPHWCGAYAHRKELGGRLVKPALHPVAWIPLTSRRRHRCWWFSFRLLPSCRCCDGDARGCLLQWSDHAIMAHNQPAVERTGTLRIIIPIA